jgi:hypothetical protein
MGVPGFSLQGVRAAERSLNCRLSSSDRSLDIAVLRFQFRPARLNPPAFRRSGTS